MQSHDFEMSILVGNKPITEYHHEGSIYVEGRKGSDYTIRLCNRSGNRACFILSVDGLSVIDGKGAGNDSPGYVLSPWETLDVACYKVNDETGAKFEFGSKGKSYSAETGHGTANVGVIAALVFREKKVIHHQYVPPRYGHYDNTGLWGDGVLRSAGSFSSNSTATGRMPRSFQDGLTLRNMASTKAKASTKAMASQDMDEFEAQALGTSFGEAMEWKTKTINFERESASAASLVIFYDSRKNLELRGIEFKKKVPPLPNPFPANTGCPVPANWNDGKKKKLKNR